jgi:hypothetical protein
MIKSPIKKIEDLTEALKYFNCFHDASIASIEFIKERSLNSDGNLVYLCGNVEDFKLCDIRMKLLHNNYKGAEKKQVIEILCRKSVEFSFGQNNGFDYSDVYHVDGKENGGFLELKFLATNQNVVCLTLRCPEIEFKEL